MTPQAEGPTSPALGARRRSLFGLPPDLQRAAAARLSWLAPSIAAVFVAVEGGQAVAQPQLAAILGDPVNLALLGAVVLAAGGIFAIWRYRLLTPAALLGIGLLFEVLVAFAIAMVETAWPFEPSRPLLGISALGPWIVAVGVLIPNHPLWTLATALAAATTWPVAYAINASRLDFEPVPFQTLAVWPSINYALVLMTYVVTRWIYGTAVAAQTAEELGSYRLVAPIGRGGMGEVWRATHQMLARTAAIKLIRTDSEGRHADISVRRFRREAEAIARLQSPNSVYLFDFGIARDGRFYYVMELLDGISLQDLVTTFGPQPAARVIAILVQVCESLGEAHYLGIVHRDLKPSNIMLCKVALHHDVVKVLDFGLAKFVERPDDTQLTAEGSAAGTPAYMAPEIALGQTNVDGQADIYALGCVGYFLLTGSLVFPDEHAMSMALKHVQTPPTPPSERTELPIPADLEAVILACLAKDPAERPAGATDVAARLQACAVPAWSAAEAAAWWARHLPVTAAAAARDRTPGAEPPMIRKAQE